MARAISNIDKEIAKVKFILSEKQDELSRIKRKTDMSEREIIYVGRETELIELVNSLVLEVKKNFSATLGKVPPVAYEFEENVIGALLLEKSALKEVVSYLKPEHFYHEKHTLIYKAVLALNERKEPVDMSTVVMELRRTGDLDTIGGAYVIAELTARMASAANIDYHGRVIVEMAIKRRLITAASELIYSGYDDRKNCFAMLDFAESEIIESRAWVKR